MPIKKCKDCGQEKAINEFYGVQGECKDCTKLRVKRYSHSERGKEMASKWWKTEKGREKQRRHRLRFRKENPEKHKAHYLAMSALRRGILKKQPCEKCLSKKVEMHHDDYSKPLEVRWLCQKHHRLM